MRELRNQGKCHQQGTKRTKCNDGTKQTKHNKKTKATEKPRNKNKNKARKEAMEIMEPRNQINHGIEGNKGTKEPARKKCN